MRRVDAERCGTVARKLGMTRVFDDSGQARVATVLKIENCCVVGHRTPDKNGYAAVCIGWGKEKARNQAQAGEYKSKSLSPRKNVTEFRVKEEAEMPPLGTPINANHFHAGQKVDVSGKTRGHGFTGAMKRHGFKGLEATHGVSISHRSHGSTGHSQDPGRVFKGKKMAGHDGDKRITVLSLEVIATNLEDNLILVAGAVPGATKTSVLVRDAIRGANFDPAKLEIVEAPQKAEQTNDTENTKAENETADLAQDKATDKAQDKAQDKATETQTENKQ